MGGQGLKPSSRPGSFPAEFTIVDSTAGEYGIRVIDEYLLRIGGREDHVLALGALAGAHDDFSAGLEAAAYQHVDR